MFLGTTAPPRRLLYLNFVLEVNTVRLAPNTVKSALLDTIATLDPQFLPDAHLASTVWEVQTLTSSVLSELTAQRDQADPLPALTVCMVQAPLKTSMKSQAARHVVVACTLRTIQPSALIVHLVTCVKVRLQVRSLSQLRMRAVTSAQLVSIALSVVTSLASAQLVLTQRRREAPLPKSACLARSIGITTYLDKVVARSVDPHQQLMVVPPLANVMAPIEISLNLQVHVFAPLVTNQRTVLKMLTQVKTANKLWRKFALVIKKSTWLVAVSHLLRKRPSVPSNALAHQASSLMEQVCVSVMCRLISLKSVTRLVLKICPSPNLTLPVRWLSQTP